MLSIIQARDERDFAEIDALTWEYLTWADGNTRELYDMEYDVAAAHQGDIAARATYLPPKGRLLLASVNGASAGCVRLRELEPGTGEAKRLYVRPAFRGQGVGRQLVARLIEEARDIGYRRLLLDSSGFQRAAHALYRRAGFTEVAPYEGSEIPEEYRQHWLFMELPLVE